MDRLIDRLIVPAFWTMSVICLVNLNDFARLLFGVERLFSGLLLVCCLVVLTGLLRVRPLGALGASGVLILATLASYVGIGMAMDIVNGSDPRWEAVGYLVGHLASILLIAATAIGARVVWGRIGGERLMKGILLVMLATCALVVASPWLIEFYVVRPLGLGGRFYGSFSNPNEAAVVCGFAAALALVFVRTGRAPWLAGGGLALALAALALTFSRTAWLAMPVVLAHALLASRPRERRRLAGALVLAGVLAAPPAVSLGAESLQDPTRFSAWNSCCRPSAPTPWTASRWEAGTSSGGSGRRRWSRRRWSETASGGSTTSRNPGSTTRASTFGVHNEARTISIWCSGARRASSRWSCSSCSWER